MNGIKTFSKNYSYLHPWQMSPLFDPWGPSTCPLGEKGPDKKCRDSVNCVINEFNYHEHIVPLKQWNEVVVSSLYGRRLKILCFFQSAFVNNMFSAKMRNMKLPSQCLRAILLLRQCILKVILQNHTSSNLSLQF